MGLTKKQIEKQDHVDNSIHNLMVDLSPNDLKGQINWDISAIGNIRDVICNELIRSLDIPKAKEAQFVNKFYPLMKHKG